MTVINHKDLDILDSNKGKRCKIIDKHNSKIEGIFVKTQFNSTNYEIRVIIRIGSNEYPILVDQITSFEVDI